MAATIATLTFETACLSDAIAELQLVHAALARRHGAQFRELDRRIEALTEDPTGIVAMHWLGAGAVLAAPSGELTEILRMSRQLGVIAP